jgi:uncharacterized small protein (DUF1192 family)
MMLVSRERSRILKPKQTTETTNMSETNTNTTGIKRPRRSIEERKAALMAELARLEAKAAGTFDETSEEGYALKRLRAAVRSRETALGNAFNVLNGKAGTEKSPAVSSIGVKIQNARARLDNLIVAEQRAVEQIAALPADIETLRALVERAEKGETVEMPTNLYRLPTYEERTDAEREAAFVRD